MKPVKTLFLLPSLRRAGAQTQTVDLLNAMGGGFSRTLVVYESNLDQLSRLDRSKTDFIHIQRTELIDFNLVRRIARIIDEQDIELLHCTLQFALFMGWLARRRSTRKPLLVASIHTTRNVSIKDELLDRLLYRRILRNCEKIIFVCKTQAEYWRGKFPELGDKAAVVYNGVDPARFSPGKAVDKGRSLRRRHSIGDNSFVFCCIAGFRREKGHGLLVRAFSEIGEDSHLLLAGEGEFRPGIEELVDRLGLSERVHFLGNVEDVRPVLGAADVSVLASTAVETFSIAMLESMAMEVPVVATDIGGLKEAVIPGRTGELVPLGNFIALRKAMVQRLNDRRGTAGMGRQARAEVLRRFTIAIMTENTEQLLREAMRHPGS
ncbi:MAG: glycosyltransferase [Desulfobacterales bacterium]|nr:glycosyltransferase [Desulfobacterales bacterium]